MATKSLYCKDYSREYAGEKSQQINDFTVRFKEDEWDSKIKEILKPVLGQLKHEITEKCERGYVYSHLPMSFSPPPQTKKFGTLLSNFRAKVTHLISRVSENDVVPMANPVEKFLKKFLRNYDIDRIREQRVFHSFSIGRKIIPQENTDETINTQIENTINGVCLRKPVKDNQKVGDHAEVHYCKDQIFSTSNLIKRTSDFYRKFAELTIDNDIERDKKKKNKEK